MNKDEMKMIEQIRKDFVARCLKGSDGCDLRDCQHCHAESLYNAGYRKVAEDEIVESMKTYERARQETAREILQELKDKLLKPHSYGYERAIIELLIEKYGIELED